MAAEKFNLDTVHSNIGFSVRHLKISRVSGHFKTWHGTLLVDESNPAASQAEVSIEAASIDTKEPQRDDHLRSGDFLDAANHSTLNFKSTKIEKLSDDRYKVTGDLTIRGATHEVVLDTEYLGRAKDPWGGERIGFFAKTTINRKDFGLTFNIPLEGGGVVVGEKVEITLDIEAVKETVAAA